MASSPDGQMTCQQALQLFDEYIMNDPSLTAEDRIAFEAHLGNCPECAREYEENKLVVGLVMEYWPGKPENQAFLEKASQPVRCRMTARESWQDIKRRMPELVQREKRWKRLRLARRVGAVAACLILSLSTWLTFSIHSKFDQKLQTGEQVASVLESTIKVELVSAGRNEVIPHGQLVAASDSLKTLWINHNRQVVLNIGTELSVEPYGLGCLVKLDKGEIYTKVEHDGKPFIVETQHGRAVITGTTFNIKADHEGMSLAVVDGLVRFESEEGIVDVAGGYQSSIASGMKPSKPMACDIVKIVEWAKERKVSEFASVSMPGISVSDLPGPIPISASYRNLEDINFKVWIEWHREWFEWEFPWTKRLKEVLAQRGLEVDTIDLLIESKDFWRFAWPENSRTQLLVESKQVVQKAATQHGVKIDEILSAKFLVQPTQISGVKAFARWLEKYPESIDGNQVIDSIHAVAFLINTRSLAWLVIQSGQNQVQDKPRVLDLLAEQISIASDLLERLSQLLVSEKESVCSVPQYDELVKKIKDDISAMMEIEKEFSE